ncbi:ATP-binding protein [Rhodoblastus sp.]|uniref:ATP-binding protein n=1 Tax=Rhodoblastus sp. TaxID=1962975 RepID=UPI0035AF4FD2
MSRLRGVFPRVPRFRALVARLRPRPSSFAGPASRNVWENPEQGIVLNRLTLALAALVAAALHAHFGDAAAQDYYARGLPLIRTYVLMTGLIQAHLALHPAPHAIRRILSIGADAGFISAGLCLGGGAAAYLAPLYFWLILGYGVRLGALYMGAAVASSVIGFAVVVTQTPFWQDNATLSAGWFSSLIIIPGYGAVLLRRLNEARAEAERANRAKTLLLANVSHELRTPLTAILGLGELLKQTGLDTAQREMVQTMSGAAEIQLRHIEALLRVSRDEIGGEGARAEGVDLFALLLSLRALLAVEADKKGVRLGLVIDASAPRHILSEPGLLLDILQNLGGNAVKFTQHGAVAIHLRAARRASGDLLLRFEVRDTGIGIDAADQDRIFEAFTQAGPDIARRFGGNGLGLAIARRRLESRGGRIGVESEAGKGALFWFELAAGLDETAPVEAVAAAPALRFDAAGAEGPQSRAPVCVVADEPFDILALARQFAVCAAARPSDPDGIARAQRNAAQLAALAGGGQAPSLVGDPAGRNHLAGRRVLLAEDNGVNRKILAAMLAAGGLDVVCVQDGHAALEAMLEDQFDLILLDLNLPRISGLDAARLYRFGVPDAARAPILALTADASPERRAECAEAGIAACLTKPIAPAALIEAIDSALRAAAEAPDARPAPRARPAATLAPEALDALARLGGEDFVADVIAQFALEGAEIVERLSCAVEQGDIGAFRREAHALESSAGNVGAEALADLCRSWRAAAPDDFVLYGDDYLDDLRCEWARATRSLSDALTRRSAAEPAARDGRGAAA